MVYLSLDIQTLTYLTWEDWGKGAPSKSITEISEMEYKDWYANKSNASWIFIMLLTCSINLDLNAMETFWISCGVHLVDKGELQNLILLSFIILDLITALKFVYVGLRINNTSVLVLHYKQTSAFYNDLFFLQWIDFKHS